MTAQLLAFRADFKRHLQGWGLSLALHVTAVGTALSLMTGLQAPPIPEPFQWNVSLVQPSPELERQAGAPDAPREPTRQAEAPAPVQQSVAKQEPVAVERQEAPPIETPAPVQAQVQAPAPVVESRAQPAPLPQEPSPIPERKPVEEVPAPVTASARQSTESTDLQASKKHPRQASAETQRPIKTQEAPPQPSRLEAASIQPVPASQTPVSPSPAPSSAQAAQKRDYGWLAEALWKRIEQLKQYPISARLNRWEGKVVLRAVIMDDGNLADLRVAKSSGYEVLDQDALEILRQTAPIKLPQPLGQPQIVIHVPISYQLK
jgi:protein TonB